MSSQLENLHLELFGALSEFLLANEVCWLWLSGCKRIQHLLEQGVTSFHHLPTRRRTYLWPSFISRFKRLQTASIESTRDWNWSKLYSSVDLGTISTSITSLKLNFSNGLLSLLHPPSMDVSSDLVLSMMPLLAVFPNLANLYVLDSIGTFRSGKNLLSSWDPILTLPLSSLHLSLRDPFPTDLFKSLSPTIASLAISPIDGELVSFPPHLVELSLDNFGGRLNSSALPNTLLRITLNCKQHATIECCNWPIELEKLQFTHSTHRLSHSDVKSLPKTLLSLILAVQYFEFASLHDLPQKLTFFYLNCLGALSTVSAEEWTQFEPKRLPPGLVDTFIDYLIMRTPTERLNTFPIGIRPSRMVFIESLESIDPYVTIMADRLESLSWCTSEPQINWSFKNLKILDFNDSVHPGQLYLTIPLLPFLEQLMIGRYIEDPSLALNKIISPFFDHLSVNCHPLSLCKWDKRWLQHVSYLNLRFVPKIESKLEYLTFLTPIGRQVSKSSRDDILAMSKPDWNDWKEFGGTRTKEDGEKVVLINWKLYAPLLPRSLFTLILPPYLEDPYHYGTAECDWPPKLRIFEGFLPPNLWSSLPQSLQDLGCTVESSDLAELASNLARWPKRVNSISIHFVHPTHVEAKKDLPIFAKFYQERPHLLSLHIGTTNLSEPPILNLDPLPGAIETTFGLGPSM